MIDKLCVLALILLAVLAAVPLVRGQYLRWLRERARMTEKNNFEPGDRVRIVGGVWASNSGTVVLVAKDAVKVRADTRLLNVIVRPYDLERIE